MVPNLGGQHADHHLNSRDARRNFASGRRNWLPLLLTGAVRYGAVHARPSVLLFGSIPLHWELRAPGQEATQTNTKVSAVIRVLRPDQLFGLQPVRCQMNETRTRCDSTLSHRALMARRHQRITRIGGET